MKRTISIFMAIGLMLFSVAAFAQQEQAIKAPDVMPEYPGGTKALFEFISRHLQYPAKAAQKEIEGKVVLQFVVTTTGEVSDVKVLKSVDEDIDAEAVRVCKLLTGFKPGMVDGKPVNVLYALPISFSLRDDEPDITNGILADANAGDMEAQYIVGFCYYSGKGVPVDWVVARYYLEKAAEQGHPDAAHLLENVREHLPIMLK